MQGFLEVDLEVSLEVEALPKDVTHLPPEKAVGGQGEALDQRKEKDPCTKEKWPPGERKGYCQCPTILKGIAVVKTIPLQREDCQLGLVHTLTQATEVNRSITVCLLL